MRHKTTQLCKAKKGETKYKDINNNNKIGGGGKQQEKSKVKQIHLFGTKKKSNYICIYIAATHTGGEGHRKKSKGIFFVVERTTKNINIVHAKTKKRVTTKRQIEKYTKQISRKK
eukprot:GEMP01134469.1.p1 GENE.GEMP01134469.1~~GEMP01134469.1.p1  ORF type:complete len:115 (-),score=3.88 GEMP01134469.1:98-442(-)